MLYYIVLSTIIFIPTTISIMKFRKPVKNNNLEITEYEYIDLWSDLD